MKYWLINLGIIVLISVSTAGCTVVRIMQTQSGFAVEKTATNTEERKTDLNKRDFRLGFGATNDSLGIRLEYRPYYNLESREIVTYKPSLKGGRSLELLIGASVLVGVATWVLSDVLVDTGEVAVNDDGELYNVTEFDWDRMSPAQIVSVAGMSLDLILWTYYATEYKATVHEPWKSRGEVAGEWQLLRNHPYRVELGDYGFSKDYLSKSGQESIAITEFLSEIKNPASLMEIESASLRASTQFDRKPYEKTIRLTTTKDLQPFRDTALAALGIDMISSGKPRLMPRAEAIAQWHEGTVSAGNTATLNVTAENTGKGELYRLTAITVSQVPTFNNRELKFRKIAPGESKMVPVSFKVDELMLTRDIPLRLRFSEYNGYVPEDIEARLHVTGQPRPKFDYNYRVVDGGTRDSVGNGDGIFQRGESVDIQVTVRNSGAGTATGVNTQLKLRNPIGGTQHGAAEKLFASIAPGASKTTTFNIGVKPRSTARSLILDLAVTEEIFGTEVRLDDKIILPVGEVAAPKIAVLDGEATITAEPATLRDGADSSTPEVAEIPKNTRVHITGQLGDWYRVELNELTGWVQTRELTTRAIAATPGTGTQSQKVRVVKVFQKQAPVVTLVEPTQSRVSVEGQTLALTATAVDDKGITRVELTVNGEVIEKAGRGMRAAAPKDRTIKETIPLTYGENTIRLVIYDTDNQASEPLVIFATRTREQPRRDYALLFATDRYDDWEPLKNPIHDAQTVGNELESRYGFSVELVRNPTRKQIFEKLLKYAEKRYNADDQLLIFFAGHGHFVEGFGAGYLIAGDSMRAAQDPGMTTAIQHTQLHQIINNIPCEHIFLVIDACFSGTFDERVAQRGEEADELYKGVDPTAFIKRTLAIKTRWYLTSGSKEYVPDGKPGAHSPFARNMLEALRSDGGKDGILTLNELEGYVEKTKPKPQSGEFGDNAPGSNFLFIRK